MVGADLPPGKWSAWLVGAWWPALPDAPATGATYWRGAGEIKHNEARDLQDERSRLTVNRGRTADDLMDRYWRGEQRLLTIGDQCDTKSVQSGRVVDAVNNLRDRLRDIAHSGNDEIDRILSGKGPGARVGRCWAGSGATGLTGAVMVIRILSIPEYGSGPTTCARHHPPRK